MMTRVVFIVVVAVNVAVVVDVKNDDETSRWLW